MSYQENKPTHNHFYGGFKQKGQNISKNATRGLDFESQNGIDNQQTCVIGTRLIITMSAYLYLNELVSKEYIQPHPFNLPASR